MRVVRGVLLLIQVVIAGFYAWSAILMWGPFVAGTLPSKLFVATIVLWPVIGLVALSRGNRFLGLSLTAALALLTTAHVLITLTFLTTV